MTKTYDIVIQKDTEGYYIASVPALPGCHTQAKSLDTLMKRIGEAIELCVEELGHKAASQAQFVGIQRMEVTV